MADSRVTARMLRTILKSERLDEVCGFWLNDRDYAAYRAALEAIERHEPLAALDTTFGSFFERPVHRLGISAEIGPSLVEVKTVHELPELADG